MPGQKSREYVWLLIYGYGVLEEGKNIGLGQIHSHGTIISRQQFLVVSWGKEFPETHMGGWGSMAKFADDMKLRGVPSWFSYVPPLFISPLKRSNLVLSRARIKAISQFLLHVKVQSSPIFSKFSVCFQLQSIVVLWYSGSYWSLHVESTWPWARQLLGPRGHGENRWGHSGSAGHQVRERKILCSLGIILAWLGKDQKPF